MRTTIRELVGLRDRCVGKRLWPTYAEAERAVGQLIRAGHHRPERGTLAPYHCRVCGRGYHLGHIRGGRP